MVITLCFTLTLHSLIDKVMSSQEAAVTEQIAKGFVHHRSRVRDPVDTVLSTELLNDYHHIKVECLLVCVEGRGRISRPGLTQDIKMGSCVFQFHIDG